MSKKPQKQWMVKITKEDPKKPFPKYSPGEILKRPAMQ